MKAKNEARMEKLGGLVGQDPYYFISKNLGKEHGKIMRGIVNKDTTRLLKGNEHGRDSRSVVEFAQTICIDWGVEIAGQRQLEFDGWAVQRYGCDKGFKFLHRADVNCDPDLIIRKNGKTYYCEIIADYFEFWNSKKVGHFRDKKLPHLKELAKEHPVLIMAIDVTNRTYMLIEIKPDMESKTVEKWGKKAQEVSMEGYAILPFKPLKVS